MSAEIEIIKNTMEISFNDIPAGKFFNFEGKVFIKTDVVSHSTQSIICIRMVDGISILLSPESTVQYKMYKSAKLTLKE